MVAEKFNLRLESHIRESLAEEAKRRGQTSAALARTFIREGLSGHDALSGKILETQERLLHMLIVMEAMIGADLHNSVHNWYLQEHPKEANESTTEYLLRVTPLYRAKLEASLASGSKIVESISNGTIGQKIRFGRKS